jgi:hypothetical protein
MTDKAELVDATSTDVVLYDQTLFPELRWQDPNEVNARFAARFGTAKNLEDLYDASGGGSIKNLVGETIQLLDVAFVAYQADDGVIPNGLAIAANVKTGEVVQFACTAMQPNMFMARAVTLGLLPQKDGSAPVTVRVTESKTRNGHTAVNFDRP